MARLRASIQWEYDIPDDPSERQKTYGASAVESCALIDQGNIADDPTAALHGALDEEHLIVRVEVIDD